MPLKNGQFYDVVFRVHTESFARMPLERDDFSSVSSSPRFRQMTRSCPRFPEVSNPPV